jgi:hypothetical protein
VADLSILIPSRNEMFLRRTVEDVLANSRADTEVIAVLDGAWAEPQLEQHPKVTLIYHPQSVGQRAATNEAARVSTADYVMKLDAHCSVDEGFDVKLLEAAKALGLDVTQIPAQKNLHAFDWVCIGGPGGAAPCGWRQYQGPTPMTKGAAGLMLTPDAPLVPGCPKCGGEVQRDIVWKPRRGVTTTAWRFDAELHFQYWGEFEKRPEGRGEITETMSCLGACFFMARDRYWELGGLDEGHGSWGQMGIEIGCKSWLSGGRMVTNKRTWFAHMFRTQGGDFGFPYEVKGSEQEKARRYSRELWNNDRWPGQVLPLRWLIDHFAPVPGWESQGWKVPKGSPPVGEPVAALPAPSDSAAAPAAAPAPRRKGIVYYSDFHAPTEVLVAARKQLVRASNGARIVSVTLENGGLPWPGDVQDLRLALARGYLTMFRQILLGLEASDADVVFLAEHDVLYHPSHFDFVPPRDDVYFYNVNTWKVDVTTGRALTYLTKQTSGLCASRRLLLQHYRKRVERVEREGFTRKMGFEPGTHRTPRGIDDVLSLTWRSEWPNIDIRHSGNLTQSRWSQDQFRDRRCCQEWREADEVPGWGVTKGRFWDLVREALP